MIKNVLLKLCFPIALLCLVGSVIAQNQQTIIKTSADYGLKCDGNTDDTQRFMNAIGTGQGSQNLYIIFVNGVCNIGWVNPINVPSYVTLDFMQQGSLFLKAGSTLNVNSSIVDPDYHPIFTGPGQYNIIPKNAVTCMSVTGGTACQATGGAGVAASSTPEGYLNWQPSNLLTQTCATNTITLPGARKDQDFLAEEWPSTLPANLIGIMHISASDTVEVRICNPTASTVSFSAALTWGAKVVR